eukprot:GAHX01000281.1.p1 GENE.GAHX01000281.1~~GAHX01000281.1.p1  ORF type:complete len:695 (-),score=163.37 GAHX01000281.1:36-2072(-)
MALQIDQENLLTRVPHTLNYKASFTKIHIDGKNFLVWFSGSTLIRYCLDAGRVDLTANLIISPVGVYYNPNSRLLLVTDALGSFYVVTPSFDVIYTANRNDEDVQNGIIDKTGNFVILYAFSGRNNLAVLNIHDNSVQPSPTKITAGVVAMEHLTDDCLLAIDLKNTVFLANMTSGETYAELEVGIVPQCFTITHRSEDEIRIVIPNNFNELITLIITKKMVTVDGRTQNKYELAKGEVIKTTVKRVYDVAVVSGFNTKEVKLAICGLSPNIEVIDMATKESTLLTPYKTLGYDLEGSELSHTDRLFGLTVYNNKLYAVNRDGEFFVYKDISNKSNLNSRENVNVIKAFGGNNVGMTNIRYKDSIMSLSNEEVLIQSKEENRSFSFKTALNNISLSNLQRVDTEGVVLIGSGMGSLTLFKLNVPAYEQLDSTKAIQDQFVDAEVLFNQNNLDVCKICLSYSREENTQFSTKALVLARNKEEMRSPYYLFLLDIQTKQITNLYTKNYKKDGISYLKYSTEAKCFVVGFEHGAVDLIKNDDLCTQKGVTKVESLKNRSEAVMAVSFNEEGTKIAVVNSTFITLWITKDGKWVGRPRPAKSHMIAICDMEWLGENLAVFSKDGKFEFWKNYGKVVGMNKAQFSDVHMGITKVERMLGSKEKEFLVVSSSNTGFRMTLKETQ